MARPKQIRWSVIKALKLAHPYMLSQEVLMASVNFDVRPPVTLAEFERELEEMGKRRWIVRIPDDDGENKVKITTEGRAAGNE